MRASDHLKSCVTAIAIGAVAGALLAALIAGVFYLLSDGAVLTRNDFGKALAVLLGLGAVAGALQGYGAFSESRVRDKNATKGN